MLNYDSCLVIDVEGRTGGLAILWKDSVKCRVLNYSRNFINLVVEHNEKGDWRLTFYYGYPEINRRRMAWDLLIELRDMSTLQWCVIGDFNDLLSQADKRGLLSHPNWLCSEFRSAVNDCDLTYIHLEEWLSNFPNVKLTNLLSSHCDHNSILLHCNSMIKKQYKSEFKFENSWMKEEDIEEVVNEGSDIGEGIEITHRLTHCADKLQRWGRKKKRDLKMKLWSMRLEWSD
ncbi:endonuclease/exonuclease/phosphatase family protein [Trifolium pratense]|uniref:Endonuclease/exonuclease/phosphatase family protein n=1 Tax=Trifolium pratense TaxID=57577 RepID=A0A2K3M9C6_TRIPR|nr:endonuclease/exonuclease/phosphatase family protein [Trifolium pratense]